MARRGRRGGKNKRKRHANQTSQGYRRAPARMPVRNVQGLMMWDYYPVAGQLIRNADPNRIRSVFATATERIGQQQQLAHEIEQSDDHIRGTCEVRRMAVTRMEVTVEPGDPSPLGKLIADMAEDIIAAPWYRNSIDWLLGVFLKQNAATELIWQSRVVRMPDGSGERRMWVVDGTREVEPWRWHFEDGVPMMYTASGEDHSSLTPITAGKFMLHSWQSNSVPGDYALIRAVAKLWWLNNLNTIDWGRMVENWGMPVPIFEYDENIGADRLNKILDNMVLLAGNKAIGVPKGTSVQVERLPEQDEHHRFREFYEKAISRLILGQTKSQIDTGANNSGSQLQGDVRDDVRDADAENLDASLQESFWQPWVAWNFGVDAPVPIVTHAPVERRDPTERAATFTAAQGIGLSLRTDEVYSSLQIERPTGPNGEEVMPDILTPDMGVAGLLPDPGLGADPQNGPERPTSLRQVETGLVALRQRATNTARDRAVSAAAELLAERIEDVRKLAREIQSTEGTEAGKLQELMRRLPEVLPDQPDADRVELLRLVTMAAAASGANDAAGTARR